jgi:hypothetical protein
MRKHSYTVNSPDVVKETLNYGHSPVGINVLRADGHCIVSAVPPEEDSQPFHIDELGTDIRGKNVSDKALTDLLENGHIERKSE